jgi:hypothetical protein
LQSKRRKKVALDPNAKFLDIKNIKTAQNELGRQQDEFKRRDAQEEAAATSAAMLAAGMEQYLGQ